jgi:hypothetical protein
MQIPDAPFDAPAFPSLKKTYKNDRQPGSDTLVLSIHRCAAGAVWFRYLQGQNQEIGPSGDSGRQSKTTRPGDAYPSPPAVPKPHKECGLRGFID